MSGVRIDPSGVGRCWWCGEDPLYIAYHDREWGRVVTDDRRLFEKLCLEGFQCGLSWLTILRKRERFREVFHDFHVERCAEMGPADVERLLQDAGIVRHRGKIESVMNNARCIPAIVAEAGSLSRFVWSFAPPPRESAPRKSEDLPSRTPESERLSRELKRRGLSYVGPTTVYAFMQSMGLVNDHLEGCRTRATAERMRRPSIRAQETVVRARTRGDSVP